MARLIIPADSLPPVNSKSDAYFIKFRIISDDQNNSSYWSNIYEIPVTAAYTTESAVVSHSGEIVTAAWIPVENVKNYDVWISWSNGSGLWAYYGRISNTSITIATPVGANRFSIRVYKETQENEQSTSYLLYETLNANA